MMKRAVLGFAFVCCILVVGASVAQSMKLDLKGFVLGVTEQDFRARCPHGCEVDGGKITGTALNQLDPPLIGTFSFRFQFSGPVDDVVKSIIAEYGLSIDRTEILHLRNFARYFFRTRVDGLSAVLIRDKQIYDFSISHEVLKTRNRRIGEDKVEAKNPTLQVAPKF